MAGCFLVEFLSEKLFIWEKYKMLAGMPKEERQVGRHDMNGGESKLWK